VLEVVDLNAVEGARRREVLDAILTLDEQLFVYHNDDILRAYHAGLRAEAERQVALLYWGAPGQLVGFNLIALRKVGAGGATWSVITCNADFHPDHRDHDRTISDGARVVLGWIVREPWRRWVFASFVVNPSIYSRLVRLFPGVVPSLRAPLRASTFRAVLREVAGQSGHDVARDDEEAVTIFLRRPVGGADDEPQTRHVAYFREMCPRYLQGESLGVVCPLSLCTLVGSTVRRLFGSGAGLS